jgi:hypothetical protein
MITKNTVPPPRIGTMSSNALSSRVPAVAIQIATHRITAETRYSVRVLTGTSSPVALEVANPLEGARVRSQDGVLEDRGARRHQPQAGGADDSDRVARCWR